MKPEDKAKVQQALEALEDAANLLSVEDYSVAFQDDAITALRQLLEQPEPVHEPKYWDVVDPAGNIVASETDAIRGWARIAGSYKPTVEGLLGLHDQGWRVLPKVAPPAQPEPVQEPVAWHHPDCEGECIACLIERDVQAAYGAQGLAYLHRRVTTPPAQPAVPLADLIKAAQGVLAWTEIAHRPPKRDQLEVGRMAAVRLHALADLQDALSAHGITAAPTQGETK